MTTIRARITTAVVGSTAMVVAVAALLAGTTARAMLAREIDARMESRAWFYFGNLPRSQIYPPPEAAGGENGSESGGVAAGAPGDPSAISPTRSRGGDRRPPGPPSDASDPSRFPSSTRSTLFEVIDPEDGRVLMRDPDLPEGVSLAACGAEVGGEAETVAELVEGRPYRVLAVGVEATLHQFGRRRSRESDPPAEPAPPEQHAIVVYMATDVTDMQAEIARLAWILAAVWAGATALSFVVSLRLSRTVLLPVDSVSRTIAELSPTNLAARVPMESVPTELDTVVTRLNELLARVDGQFQRERATIANIAHELRNPLSALRTTLEFGLFQDPPAANRKTMESSLALALRMQSLVSGLLTLTRIEAGQEVLARESVDLVTVLQDAWDTIEARASGRGLRVEWDVPDSLRIVTSPAHVSMIASNLFDNAVSHGTGDSVVTVSVESRPGRVRWTVANPCAQAPADTDFFKAFWRSDPARAGGRHFGLGLALCDRIVRLLGGTIEARLDGGTFAITLELPVEPAAATDMPVAMERRAPVAQPPGL